jgi:uncharacterized protein (DUF1697 family)
MRRMILLLRGVNVGGVKLPMKGFRDMLTRLGLDDVRSYIQSGNAVFDDPGLGYLARLIRAGLMADFGLSFALFLFDPAEFDSIIAESPFAGEGVADGARVHVYYLAEPASPDHEALRALATTEWYRQTPRAFFFHAPQGVGRSVLAEKLGRYMKVVTTARN